MMQVGVRREVVQGCVLLTAWVLFTLVLLSNDVSRWLVTLGLMLIACQVLALVRRVVRLRRQRTSAGR
jgi:Ca2+/Na+ antiporter